MNDDERAQLEATKNFIGSYFAAASQADINAAEAALRARSSGAVEHGSSVETSRMAEGSWFGGLRAVPGGIRSAELFGETSANRLIRLAHLELVESVPHPGGGGQTRVVPVIGPELRGPIEADDVYAEPSCDALYREIATFAHLAKLAAGSPYLTEAIEGMAFALARLAAGWPSRVWDAWSDPGATVDVPRIPPMQELYSPKQPPIGLRLLDDTCVVAFPSAIIVARLRDGKVLRAIDTHDAECLAIPTPSLALLKGEVETSDTFDVRAAAMEATRRSLEAIGGDASAYDYSKLPESAPVQATCVFALDLENGTWSARPDSDLTPGVWFNESLERSYLVDDRGRSIRLRDVSDYPTITAFSPDHRFVWVEDKHGSGGVYRTRDGALVTKRSGDNDHLEGLPRLTAAGAIARARDGWYPGNKQEASALVRTPRGTWMSFGDGVVSANWKPFLVLDGASRVAAFDTHGTRLAITDGKVLRVIDVASPEPSELVRWPLAKCIEAVKRVRTARAKRKSRTRTPKPGFRRGNPV
ncbi:MAG: hypothetical protein H0T89_11870 [Deltaproteobacteria bacterium]|nr:hypothetical protein [Deltaproteobacteria bacterium]MDQ3295972.1 hypothetical protein [Myxococcota bacterium]